MENLIFSDLDPLDLYTTHSRHASVPARSFVAEGVRSAAADGGVDVDDGGGEGRAQDMGHTIVPKVSTRDPRTRGRPVAWAPSTPSTGPPTPATTLPTGEPESLEKGPWVWPEPKSIQHSTPTTAIRPADVDPGGSRKDTGGRDSAFEE